MESNRQKLQQCGICSETLGGMNLYRCSYCGEAYCSEHRLPEKHDCIGVRGKQDKRITYESRNQHNQLNTDTLPPKQQNKKTLTVKSVLIICAIVLLSAITGIAIMALNSNSDTIVGTWGEVPQQMGSDNSIIYIFYTDNTFEANQVDQSGQIINSISGKWGKLSNNQYQITINGQPVTLTYDPSTGLLNNQLKKQGPPPKSTLKPQDSIIGNWRQVGTSTLTYKQSGGTFNRYVTYTISINSDGSITSSDGFNAGQWEQINGQYIYYPSPQSTASIAGKGIITIHDGLLWFEWSSTNILGVKAWIFERD